VAPPIIITEKLKAALLTLFPLALNMKAPKIAPYNKPKFLYLT